VKSAAETRIIDLDLSSRATEGLASFIRPRGTVRELVENVTVAQLRATPGMGAATIAEVEKAIADVCGCAFVDSTRNAGKLTKAAQEFAASRELKLRSELADANMRLNRAESHRDTSTKKRTKKAR
jgi:hypothetical protein